MKTPGVEFTIGPTGLGMRVTPTDMATDAIWAAVEAATSCNMDPAAFMREVRQAWEHHRDEQKKHELHALRTR